MRQPSFVLAIDENPVLASGIAVLVGQRLGCRSDAISLQCGVLAELPEIDSEAIVIIDPLQTDVPFQSIESLFGRSVPAIAYCRELSAQEALNLLNAGFHAVVSKTSELDALVVAVQAVLAGAVHVDREFAGAIQRDGQMPKLGDPRQRLLSERELSVLKATAYGLSMKEIGRTMNLSVKTIETYKARARSKLNLHGKREIVDYAIQNGWIQ